MAAIKYDVTSRKLRMESMCICLRTILPNFIHIRFEMAEFFEESHPNKKIRLMSSYTGAVPDPTIKHQQQYTLKCK